LIIVTVVTIVDDGHHYHLHMFLNPMWELPSSPRIIS
jgi:hypothetical protein